MLYKSSMSVLHPSGFIETGNCTGPRLVRNQPSRESPGVLLDSVTDKYVTEFTVPFRNSVRSLKTLKMNWDKLDPEQQKLIADMIPIQPIIQTPSTETFTPKSALLQDPTNLNFKYWYVVIIVASLLLTMGILLMISLSGR